MKDSEIEEALRKFLFEYHQLLEEEQAKKKLHDYALDRYHEIRVKRKKVSQDHALFLFSEGYPLIETNNFDDFNGYSAVYSKNRTFLNALICIEKTQTATNYLDKNGGILTPPSDVHIVWYDYNLPESIIRGKLG